MKTAVIKNPKMSIPAYPNAADRSYYAHRFLNGILAAVTAIGAVVAIVFLLLL